MLIQACELPKADSRRSMRACCAMAEARRYHSLPADEPAAPNDNAGKMKLKADAF